MTSARRDKGSGGLQQAGPGVWRIRVYLGADPATGHPRQKERTVRGNRKGAEEALRVLRNEVAEGRHAESAASFARLYRDWLAQLARLDTRPATLDTYRTIGATHLLPHFGATPVAKIDPQALDAYYALKQRTLAANTVRLHHAILVGCLGQAVAWGWIPANPTASSRPPKAVHGTRTALDPADIVTLMAAARDDIDLVTLIALGATTGARRGELVGLQWPDVDWQADTLTIARQRVRLVGGDETGPLKSGGPRVLALGGQLRETLEVYRVAITARARALDTEPVWDGWLLSRDCGRTPLPAKWVTDSVSRLGRETGVPVTTHVFRHTAASLMAQRGVDAVTAAKRLGHTVEVMQRTYLHALPGQQLDREAAALLGDSFLALTPAVAGGLG